LKKSLKFTDAEKQVEKKRARLPTIEEAKSVLVDGKPLYKKTN
jgi:hypothetical protein